MVDRLGYVEPRQSWEPWGIAWFCDGEEGGHIGETYVKHSTEPDRESNAETWECWAANNAAAPFSKGHRVGQGFYFETQADARKAMASIKAALKAKRPLFDWEKTALANGWKPPKNWNGAT